MHISKLRNADDTTLMAENEEEIKSLLMKGKEESEKAVLKLIMGKKKKKRWWLPIPSLYGKYMGKKWKQRQILFSWAPKSLWTVTTSMKLKDTYSLEEKLWQT